MEQGKITIVMATYNGEKYLHNQIDSILKCDLFDSLVEEFIITDDNSIDATLDILEEYRKKESKILILKNNRLGVKLNFLTGMLKSKSKYIVLCDQDDVWEANKLSVLYDEIKRVEQQKNKPALVFSDSSVVDKDLKIINESFMLQNNFDVSCRLNTSMLLFKNVCQGCVMIFNRDLLKYLNASGVSEWVMHDWMLIVIASQKGVVSYVSDKLIKYRIHGGNVVGVNKNGLLKKIFSFKNQIVSYDDYIDQVFRQSMILKKDHILSRGLNFTFADWYYAENSNPRRIAALIKWRKINAKLNVLNHLN